LEGNLNSGPGREHQRQPMDKDTKDIELTRMVAGGESGRGGDFNPRAIPTWEGEGR